MFLSSVGMMQFCRLGNARAFTSIDGHCANSNADLGAIAQSISTLAIGLRQIQPANLCSERRLSCFSM